MADKIKIIPKRPTESDGPKIIREGQLSPSKNPPPPPPPPRRER